MSVDTQNTIVINGEDGKISEALFVLAPYEYRPELFLPPHPLMPHGHSFEGQEMFVTACGKILPSTQFSRDRLEDLAKIATHPELHHSEEIIQFADYILKKEMIFNEASGCWELPLKEEYDAIGRARYPHLTNKALGFYNLLAHRAAMKFLRGIEIDGMSVDHLCRSHACCNPYHLEAVVPAVNTARGAADRRHITQLRLGQPLPGVLSLAMRQI